MMWLIWVFVGFGLLWGWREAFIRFGNGLFTKNPDWTEVVGICFLSTILCWVLPFWLLWRIGDCFRINRLKPINLIQMIGGRRIRTP